MVIFFRDTSLDAFAGHGASQWEQSKVCGLPYDDLVLLRLVLELCAREYE